MLISLTTLATTALGFTVAIAWNDAVSKTVKSLFPPQNERTAARATLIYALIITVLVIMIVAVINHTRKVVHQLNGGNAKSCKECADCSHCYHQGSSSSIIHLWEPAMGTA